MKRDWRELLLSLVRQCRHPLDEGIHLVIDRHGTIIPRTPTNENVLKNLTCIRPQIGECQIEFLGALLSRVLIRTRYVKRISAHRERRPCCPAVVQKKPRQHCVGVEW